VISDGLLFRFLYVGVTGGKEIRIYSTHNNELSLNNVSVCFTARCTIYSARSGLAIMSSVCLSVPSFCLSVTLLDQDHRGWKFWKLTARIISPTPSDSL